MTSNIYAASGDVAFGGNNNPLYVRNQNELRSAFNSLQSSIASAGAPVGTVCMWVGTTANIPANYAVCNGASLSTTTYASLFAITAYRYGGAGASFLLPDFTSRSPLGITGVPTIPSTVTTTAASAVDVHTHTVNSSLSGGSVNSSFTAGNAASHTHAGGVLTAGNTAATFTAGNTSATFTAGNANNHTHGVTGNTGNTSNGHSHTYFKPNAGANAATTGQSSDHTHAVSITSTGSNTTIAVNSTFANGAVNSSFANGAVNTSITAPGDPNTTIGVNSSFTAGNANTALTAGNASTINTSTPAHTHTTPTVQIIFIIKVA